MMTLMAAAVIAAAQPANALANSPPPDAAVMLMGGGFDQNGQLAGMKDCRGKDMMSKLDQSHRPGHAAHSAR